MKEKPQLEAKPYVCSVAKKTVKKIVGSFCERELAPKRTFDRRSFRYKQSGKSWLLVGCPTKKWNAKTKRCKVGTKAHKILVNAPTGSHCAVGAKHVAK